MMIQSYNTWQHPYTPSKQYKKRIAYFSMEFAVDQATSHMHEADQAKYTNSGK